MAHESATSLLASGVENVIVLDPGESWTPEARPPKAGEIEERAMSPERLSADLADYRARRIDHVQAAIARAAIPTRDLGPDLRIYFQRLVSLNPYFTNRVGLRLGLDITGINGAKWTVDFSNPQHPVSDGLWDWQYKMRFDSRWLNEILEGRLDWEGFLLSTRVELDRQPDLYNDHLLGLLKFADAEALAAVERFETQSSTDPLISVSSPSGAVWRVPRRCPHAGNDLAEFGEVDSRTGVVRCLAHHYEFDLESGRCLNATCDPLFTRGDS
jgi:UDP-MurNAc hydroxylase